MDDQYEHNFGDVIENRLMRPPLYRENLGAIFTCQAVNTLIVKPKESSYVLDMLRKSISASSLGFNHLMCDAIAGDLQEPGES